MPTRSASALLAILASLASSATMCRSMSSRSPAPPGPPSAAPAWPAAHSGRTRFGWPPEDADPDEVPAIMTAFYRILFRNLACFPIKMHNCKHGADCVNDEVRPPPATKGRGAMKVGIPREVKNHEYRVAITPAGVRELGSHGHEVFLEKDAGGGPPPAAAAC